MCCAKFCGDSGDEEQAQRKTTSMEMQTIGDASTSENDPMLGKTSKNNNTKTSKSSCFKGSSNPQSTSSHVTNTEKTRSGDG